MLRWICNIQWAKFSPLKAGGLFLGRRAPNSDHPKFQLGSVNFEIAVKKRQNSPANNSISTLLHWKLLLPESNYHTKVWFCN